MSHYRIGLAVPSSNVTVETEMPALLSSSSAASFSFHASRLRMHTVTVTRLGPYFEVSRDSSICVDRRAAGARHAVWYSVVAGVRAPAHITQHDKDALRVESA